MSGGLQRSLDDDLRALLAAEADVLANPYPLYARLRETPAYRFGNMTVVSSHALVKELYRDAGRFTKHPSRTAGIERKFELLGELELGLMHEIMAFEEGFLSRKNGADHVRVRSAVARYFTPKRVGGLERSIRDTLDTLLDHLSTGGEVDLARIAYTLPLLVVMELLGAPREDAERLKRWGDAIQRPSARTPVPPEDVREAHRALVEYREYSRALVAQHRRDGTRGELVAGLLDAAEGERLTEDELVAFFLHTLFAGHETTANLIGNGLVALLAHRRQWEWLCADPSLVPTAVEELLRYDPPAQFGVRRASQHTEIGGVEVAAGSSIMVMIAAANRDPTVYREPDTLDIGRSPNDHLSLAFGPHFCLGASVARLEGRLTVAAFAERFPAMRLAVPASELERNPNAVLRGFRRLPVRLAGSG